MICFSTEKEVCTDIAWLPGHVPCVCPGTQWVTSRVTPKTLPRNPAPLPADFLHLIDQSCITWVSYPRRQAEKAISISSPWSGSQKKEWGERSWKASMSKAEWFPRQLTVSMPGVGLTALTAALSSLSGRMIKRKKKQEPGHWHLKTRLHHGTVTCWLWLRENCHLISLNSVPSSVDEDQTYLLQSVEVNERMDGQNLRWIVSFYYHASYFITKQKQVVSSHHWINGETLVNPCASTKQVGKFPTSQTSKALLKLLSFWKKKKKKMTHHSSTTLEDTWFPLSDINPPEANSQITAFLLKKPVYIRTSNLLWNKAPIQTMTPLTCS